jgi:hypothetical protein
MRFKRDKPLSDLEEVQRRKAMLAEQIAGLEQLPEQIRRERQERENTLPPRDLLERIAREKEFDKKVSSGEVANVKQELARNSAMTILLLIAAAALLWWAYRQLEHHGFL